MSSTTEEEKRRKIAEACGWRRIELIEGKLWGRSPIGSDLRAEIPDFFHDLNACAEMEKTLMDEEYRSYLAWLHILTRGIVHEAHGAVMGATFSMEMMMPIHRASAPHRAEAFCAVKGIL